MEPAAQLSSLLGNSGGATLGKECWIKSSFGTEFSQNLTFCLFRSISPPFHLEISLAIQASWLVIQDSPLLPSRMEVGHIRKPSPFSYLEGLTTTFRVFFLPSIWGQERPSLLFNKMELKGSEQQNNSDFFNAAFYLDKQCYNQQWNSLCTRQFWRGWERGSTCLVIARTQQHTEWYSCICSQYFKF